MDGKPLWIESMTDEELLAFNDQLLSHLMEVGYYAGKTEESWWKIYEYIVDECQIRITAKGW